MKRILLLASLLSFAAQVPAHAQSQFLAKLISPENKEMLKAVGSGIACDARAVAAEASVIANDVLYTAETAICMPFILAVQGLKALGLGVRFVGKNYPLVGLAASSGLMLTMFVKADQYEREHRAGNYNAKDKSNACALAGFCSCIAALGFTKAALEKYAPRA